LPATQETRGEKGHGGGAINGIDHLWGIADVAWGVRDLFSNDGLFLLSKVTEMGESKKNKSVATEKKEERVRCTTKEGRLACSGGNLRNPNALRLQNGRVLIERARCSTSKRKTAF